MENEVLTIDGALGEGGGQILRTSLSLSMCLQRPIRVINIRANRGKPGLLRQHLTCVRAAQTICNAELTGDELGSMQIDFVPGKIQAGSYRFAIGSAGSTNLVMQTILPALMIADGGSQVDFEGGTHNQSAPSLEFIRGSFLPLLQKLGVTVDCDIQRYGFYPHGGGQWTARIQPANSGQRLKLKSRGKSLGCKAVALTSKIPEHVATRELRQVMKRLGWSEVETESQSVNAFGPGNLLSLAMQFEHLTVHCEAVAKRGVRAEKVADEAIEELRSYLQSEAAVGEHLTDQLLLPLVVLAGGSFTCNLVSSHSQTNMQVINLFTGGHVQLRQKAQELYEFQVEGLHLGH